MTKSKEALEKISNGYTNDLLTNEWFEWLQTIKQDLENYEKLKQTHDKTLINNGELVIKVCNLEKENQDLRAFVDAYANARDDLLIRNQHLEEENEKLEKFIKLCLTKYVPLDSLSPAFWERKKRWLEDMSYDYYLFLCEEICDYVVKGNDKLTEKEFDLVYSFLKEVLE